MPLNAHYCDYPRRSCDSVRKNVDYGYLLTDECCQYA